MALIKGRRLVTDTWLSVADDADLPAEGDVIVSFKRWREQQPALVARAGKLGVRLPSDTAWQEVKDGSEHVSLFAVEFPKFTDGRGYSLGRLIRERFGFQGELRAVGYVLRDHLFYLLRCGFDAFELKAGKDAEGALAAFDELSVKYQPAVDEALPLFRRF